MLVQGKPHPAQPRFVAILWGEPSASSRAGLMCPVLSFDEVLAKGAPHSRAFVPAQLKGSDLATLVYTSGTTGNSKVKTHPAIHQCALANADLARIFSRLHRGWHGAGQLRVLFRHAGT